MAEEWNAAQADEKAADQKSTVTYHTGASVASKASYS